MTAPKGHATAARNAANERSRRISPTMEWIIAAIVISAVIAAIVYFGRDIRSSTGGHSGAPADAPVEVVTDLPGAASF